MLLSGDDLTNRSHVERVREWLGHRRVNELLRLGRAFRPVDCSSGS